MTGHQGSWNDDETFMALLRDLGRQLAALRREARLTQKGLATRAISLALRFPWPRSADSR